MKLIGLVCVALTVACAPTPPPLPAPHPVACPEAPAPECPEQRPRIVRVKQKCEPCPETPVAPPTPARTAALTCVLGHVKTAGDMRMVVQRAMVVLWHGDQVLAETWTDDLGAFAACVDSNVLPLDIAIEISKKPFTPVMLKTRLTRGQHREYQVGFEAEGLTH